MPFKRFGAAFAVAILAAPCTGSAPAGHASDAAADAGELPDDAGECPRGGDGCGLLSLRQLRGELRTLAGGGGESRASDATAPGTPIAWCTSGGGWRAMTTAIGFANAFSKVGLFTFGDLTDVAATSGGSWFLSQFAYNEDFYWNVTRSNPQQLRSFVEKLMVAFEADASNKGAEDPILKAIGRLPKVGMLLDEVNSAAHWALWSGGLNWEEMVTKMLAASPGLRSADFYTTTSADQANRVGLKGPTLHFQTAELTAGYKKGVKFWGVSTPLHANMYMLDENKVPLSADQGASKAELPVIPVQYVVRGTEGQDSSLEEGFQRPETTAYRYHVGFVGIDTNMLRDATSITSSEGLTDIEQAPRMPEVMPISVVASASSAAVGLLASPLMLGQVIRNRLGTLAWDALKEQLPGPFNDMAICSRAVGSADSCPYPSRRFVDGGFVDTLATAQTVGLMQKKFGTQRALRFILTDSKEADGQTGSNPMMSLMRSSISSARPGAIYKGRMFYNMLDVKVFGIDYDSLAWVDLSDELENSRQRLRFAEATGITVDNPAFGVEAGSPVELLIFEFVSELTNLDLGFSAEYAAISQGVAQSSAGSKLAKWMKGQQQ